MKTSLSKTEALDKINNFFQRESFSSDEVKKIKRLAMKFNIKLADKRKLFCKKCFSKLRGKTRVTKTHKTIICEICRTLNKFSIRSE